MTLEKLNNLFKSGNLKQEKPDNNEFKGLLYSARVRLKDAGLQALSIESQFDLAYNASHALSLAALRWHGFRSENRYLVFQCLQHTLDVGPEVWRILAKCHALRNRSEYEGTLEIDEQLLAELLETSRLLLKKVTALESLK